MKFLYKHVKIETPIGTVEGKLQHIDYRLSHNNLDAYPQCLILENDGKILIVKSWKTIKLIELL